eukprot:6324754-Amphidinium_carterae.1
MTQASILNCRVISKAWHGCLDHMLGLGACEVNRVDLTAMSAEAFKVGAQHVKATHETSKAELQLEVNRAIAFEGQAQCHVQAEIRERPLRMWVETDAPLEESKRISFRYLKKPIERHPQDPTKSTLQVCNSQPQPASSSFAVFDGEESGVVRSVLRVPCAGLEEPMTLVETPQLC